MRYRVWTGSIMLDPKNADYAIDPEGSLLMFDRDLPYVSDHTPLFSTNILDREGQEIWEGDIVDCGTQLKVVERGGFGIESAGATIFVSGIVIQMEGDVTRARVVGNIYQNRDQFPGLFEERVVQPEVGYADVYPQADPTKQLLDGYVL